MTVAKPIVASLAELIDQTAESSIAELRGHLDGPELWGDRPPPRWMEVAHRERWYQQPVVPEWRSFEAFWAAMGPTYFADAQLCRIDYDKPIGPGNAEWLTVRQSRQRGLERHPNVRPNRLPDGQLLTDVARKHGVSSNAMNERRSRGWADYDAATTTYDEVRERQREAASTRAKMLRWPGSPTFSSLNPGRHLAKGLAYLRRHPGRIELTEWSAPVESSDVWARAERMRIERDLDEVM